MIWRIAGRTHIAALCALLLGCSEGSEPAGQIEVAEADSSGVAIVSILGSVAELPIWMVADTPDVVIGAAGSIVFGSIGEVALLSGGRVLVEDNQTDELRLFDENGNDLGLVGTSGDGPGEFQNLTEMNVTDGDTAYVYDRRLYRITIFSPEGNLLSTLGITRENGGRGTLALDAWGLNTQTFVLRRMGAYDTLASDPMPRRDQRDAVLFVLNREGTVVRGPVSFQGEYSVEFERGDATAPFGNQVSVDVGRGRILYTAGVTYDIILLDEELDARRIIRWNGWEERLTEEDVESAKAKFSEAMADLRAQAPQIVDDLIEAQFSAPVVPHMRPALGKVFFDDRDRIWVSQFKLPVDRWQQEESWHVLDPTGRPLARLQLPANAQLGAVRGDKALLVVRDDLEVEHLEVMRMVTGHE